MKNNTEAVGPMLHEVTPSETAGRDTIARFRAQFRAAAYACLSILSGKTIDRVYCDFQDDFVCREIKASTHIYHFYQVKTKAKRNHQWSKPEVFGVPKRKKPEPQKISESFAGKLLLHTIRFKNSCGNVVFITNVQFDDEVDGVATALQTGDLSNKLLKLLIEKFNDVFSAYGPLDEATIKGNVGKLSLRSGVNYLNPHDHDFEAIAREAIFEYSEIDLQHVESQEIINNLIALVERKSCAKLIAQMSEKELDDAVGIGILDLLEILSISKGAYKELRNGGDSAAVRSASIIQRKLKQAGASENIIEYCSKWKCAWDVWIRDKRHSIAEFDMNALLEDVNAIKNLWSAGQMGFADLQAKIVELWDKLAAKGLTGTLSKDLLLGGVFSALVRSEAQ